MQQGMEGDKGSPRPHRDRGQKAPETARELGYHDIIPIHENVASAGSVLDLYLLIELIKVKDILIFLLLLNI